jgi:hypothetical protein
MTTTLSIAGRMLAGLVIGLALSAATQAQDSTWRLVKRELPNGAVLTPPDAYGMSSTRNGLNELVVFARAPDGKMTSVTGLSKWEWSEDRVTVTPLLRIVDMGDGKPPRYLVGGEAKSSTLAKSAGSVRYQHPIDPPFIVLEGDRMTATLDGVFVDYWEKMQ